jgi:hypothetical protein
MPQVERRSVGCFEPSVACIRGNRWRSRLSEMRPDGRDDFPRDGDHRGGRLRSPLAQVRKRNAHRSRPTVPPFSRMRKRVLDRSEAGLHLAGLDGQQVQDVIGPSDCFDRVCGFRHPGIAFIGLLQVLVRRPRARTPALGRAGVCGTCGQDLRCGGTANEAPLGEWASWRPSGAANLCTKLCT